jgi:hypothetical protein
VPPPRTSRRGEIYACGSRSAVSSCIRSTWRCGRGVRNHLIHLHAAHNTMSEVHIWQACSLHPSPRMQHPHSSTKIISTSYNAKEPESSPTCSCYHRNHPSRGRQHPSASVSGVKVKVTTPTRFPNGDKSSASGVQTNHAGIHFLESMLQNTRLCATRINQGRRRSFGLGNQPTTSLYEASATSCLGKHSSMVWTGKDL